MLSNNLPKNITAPQNTGSIGIPGFRPPNVVRAQGAPDAPAFVPFDKTKLANAGTYGEGYAYDAAAYLQNLKTALDAGQISVSDFVKFGQPAAEFAYQQIGQVSQGGSKAAQAVNPALGILQSAGFAQGPDGKPIPSLGEKYEQQVRDSILPQNLTPEERAAYLNEIPNDITLGSDQYKLEREALRTRVNNDRSINDLAGLLAKQNDQAFSVNSPTIMEDLNSRGLLQGSALGEALARERARLESNTGIELAKAKLASQDQVNAIRLGGIQRTFSAEDWAKQAALAEKLGSLQAAQDSGGGGNPLGFALKGATIGANGGPAGAGIGAGAGLLYGMGQNSNKNNGGGGTYICTHLKNIGLMTEAEVQAVHDKVYPVFKWHPIDLLIYGFLAPMFIVKADQQGYDWASLKVRLCDEIIACQTPSEAFKRYRSVCWEIIPPLLPKLRWMTGLLKAVA